MDICDDRHRDDRDGTAVRGRFDGEGVDVGCILDVDLEGHRYAGDGISGIHQVRRGIDETHVGEGVRIASIDLEVAEFCNCLI